MKNLSLTKKTICGILLFSSCGFSSFADQAVYSVFDGKQVAAKTVYSYKPDSQYEVHCKVGYITDIKLKTGESVSYSLVGDSSRWMFDQTTVGGVTHIYIKPMAEGIQTNLIVNSSTRSYRFIISEGPEAYSPIIEFTFEDEERKEIYSKPAKLTNKQKVFNEIFTTEDKLSGKKALKTLNRKYEMKKHGKIEDDMLPTDIFDDGIRTYLKMPSSNKYDLPTLYLVDENDKLTLVNYRTKDAYFVADRVFSKARLKYSAKTYVDIVATKDDSDNSDKQSISEHIQNVISEAYEDIKGIDSISTRKELSSSQKSVLIEKELAEEKQAREKAMAEIAQLKKQVETERQAREKAVLAATEAESQNRAYAEQIKQEQYKHQAMQKTMETEKQAQIAQVRQNQLREETEKTQNTVKQVSVQITPSKPITKTIISPIQTSVTESKENLVFVEKKLILNDSKKAFSEIFTTNNKLDEKKVRQALQTKQNIQTHGEIITTMLPKNTFIINDKTYFNMSKDYQGKLPQIYTFVKNRIVPVDYEVKGTYLVVNERIQKARLQYNTNTYADIVLTGGV